MQTTHDSDKRKLLEALSHGSIFFSTFVLSAGLPLGIWFISDDPVVKDNALESLNFHLNVWLYTVIFGILTWVLIGWPLLGILWIVQLVMPILAILNSLRNPDQVFRYAFIFRLL